MISDVPGSYDTVAATYAELFADELDGRPLERGLLAAYAETVSGPVLEVGCGPGQIAAHLAGLGVDVSGLDLSPAMVEQARRAHPGIRFEVGNLARLDVEPGSLGGIVAFYSLIHLPPDDLPPALAGFARALRPGGQFLTGFQIGADERLHQTDWHGHTVALDHYRRRPDAVADLLAAAGLDVRTRIVREAGPSEGVARCYLWAVSGA